MPEEKPFTISVVPEESESLAELSKRTARRDQLLNKRFGFSFDLDNPGEFPIQEVINPELKQELFTRLVSAMYQLTETQGISLSANLLDRLLIVNYSTFERIYQGETNQTLKDNLLGITFGGRLCFINMIELQRRCQRKGIDPNVQLQETGIHELWHSVDFMQILTPSDPKYREWEIVFPLRAGLQIEHPEEDKNSDVNIGLHCLNEGLKTYLTRETFKLAGVDIPPFVYNGQLKIIDLLISEIGPSPFFQASFQRHGMRILSDELNKKFGPNMLKNLSLALYKDWAEFDENFYTARTLITGRLQQPAKTPINV